MHVLQLSCFIILCHNENIHFPISFVWMVGFGQCHPIPIFLPLIIAHPWGNAIGPLNLRENNEFPRASRKNFLRFTSDGIVFAFDNLPAFLIACSAVNLQHEDMSMHMFVDILIKSAT